MTPTFRDRAVLLGETLVVADLHLGRGRTSAVEAPMGDGRDVIDRLTDLLDTVEPETVVLAGDVLHAFETVPDGASERFATIRARVADAAAELVVVAGNHDGMLTAVWDGTATDAYRLDEQTLVVHGHEIPEESAERYVFGHDHPAIEIEGRRHPCFLRGPGGPDGTEVLVLPAFNRFTAGVPINTMAADDFQSPLIRDADVLAPVVRDDAAGETLSFPPLASFRHRLR
ncbi:MAG: metallophosphoesterase [Halapricum sp.]